jgi:hypothetical protein
MFLLPQGTGGTLQKMLFSIECSLMLRVQEKGLSGGELAGPPGSHLPSLHM